MKNHRGKVLVVDNDVELLFSLTKSLASSGYSVQPAASYRQAISYGVKFRLNLLMTRHRLDQSSGVELARRLQATRYHRKLPTY